MASAKKLTDIVELQAAFWRKQFDTLTAQTDEVRALSTKVTAAAAPSMKAHVVRDVNELGRVHDFACLAVGRTDSIEFEGVPIR